MANVKNGGIIKAQQAVSAENTGANVVKKSLSVMMNEMLDSEGYKKRFQELLGNRTPQFLSAVVSLVNSDRKLQQAFSESPMTIIQAALKAATFDLPIDPNLGYAYIAPFNNKKDDGTHRMEATFIMGYKGMNQLALRAGVYKKINVVDVRQGELQQYNRLTEEIELEFIEDEDERSARPIIGWCGYYKLMNGMEKIIYMTKTQIEQHEKRHRKGKYMSKGWRDNFDEMALKTVFRRLIGKWGVMSIDYQKASPSLIASAEAVAKGQFDDEDIPTIIDAGHADNLEVPSNINPETGEILQPETELSEDDKILQESIK